MKGTLLSITVGQLELNQTDEFWQPIQSTFILVILPEEQDGWTIYIPTFRSHHLRAEPGLGKGGINYLGSPHAVRVSRVRYLGCQSKPKQRTSSLVIQMVRPSGYKEAICTPAREDQSGQDIITDLEELTVSYEIEVRNIRD